MTGRRTKRVRTEGQVALRKMRRRWYLWSILPGLLILGAIAYVSYIIQWNAYGLEKYQEDDLRNSIWSFQHTDTWLPAERWVHPYNIATAQTRQGAYRGAASNFERAEALAPALDPNESFVDYPASMLPPMCKIRVNHAAVYYHQAEAARKEANLFWDVVNANHDTGQRASSREKFEELMKAAREHLEQAVEYYTSASEAFGKAAMLLDEYQCTDPALVEDLREQKDFVDNRISIAEELQEPEWRPRNTPQDPDQPTDPDNPTDDPSNPPADDDPSDEPSDEPSQSPDDEEPSDEPGEGDSERPEQNNYTPEELDRQQQLQERNKNGTVQREEAEGSANPEPPSTKQW
ncbi:hypothetical protein ACFSYH_07150 [Populibacterium corticicola]|uniref:Uncharacterized protein n=1 Tax=Populibacterium corticicola TaxID=1812826 RepID=A0ABW5XES1_9MICO